MDKIKQKLEAYRVQADHAIERAETAERKNKTLEQGLLQKEQEITSLTRRNDALETELEKTRDKLKSSEVNMGDLAIRSENHERHVRRLEQERDAMEAKYEEAVKEYKASQAELDTLVQNLESL